jgi:hypothetical protein
MPACGLRRDARDLREFGCRQGAAVHQGVKHRGARRISRHRRDFGKSRWTRHSAFSHEGRIITRHWPAMLRSSS